MQTRSTHARSSGSDHFRCSSGRWNRRRQRWRTLAKSQRRYASVPWPQALLERLQLAHPHVGCHRPTTTAAAHSRGV